MTTITHLPTSRLERLAVEFETMPHAFDEAAAEWLTNVADRFDGSTALVNIMNDVTESVVVRSRAMAMLIADLLRA